ncbi:PepSY domain-containing protein [Duganella lactea]|nr:PepSY domain-containing protein [Duganella lactea]
MRRWHFFAGVLCVRFIFPLAVTGTVYFFHSQLLIWLGAARLTPGSISEIRS